LYRQVEMFVKKPISKSIPEKTWLMAVQVNNFVMFIAWDTFDTTTGIVLVNVWLYNEKISESAAFLILVSVWLIDWLFTVLCPAQEYVACTETSPLPVKGCKI
jgi:hypothetical protein